MARPLAAQTWDARGYAENARFVADLGAPVLELLAPRPHERVLDLGCGDGALTAKLVPLVAAVVGLDSSPELIAAARERGLDARLGDAHELPFSGEFDAVFSNAALHWMVEPERVVRAVARALRSGGRFVGELGGHGNVAAIRVAVAAELGLRGRTVAEPWYFPTARAYAEVLTAAGFEVESSELIARPTPLPTGMRGWLATFANPFLTGLDADERDALCAAVEARLRPVLCDTAGRWTADYVRLRFAARR